MKKLQQLKQAIKNPPPERLAKVEYRSHFMQILGISAVCIILINKGFWYIIFAFIFGIGISYSQGMTAYKRYEMIKSLVAPEKLEDYEKDISPSRRRSKIINSVLGSWAKWLSIISAIGGSVLVINLELSRWILMVLYPLTIFVFYSFMYFFVLYWISYPFYKRKLKGGNGK